MNEIITPEDILFLLQLDKCDDITTDSIQRYIQVVEGNILSTLNITDEDKINEIKKNPLFAEAILSGVACHLQMLRPDLLTIASDYKVGNTEETYADNLWDKLPTWCDRYQSALDSITIVLSEFKSVETFRRKGMNRRPDWWHYGF